MLHPVKGCNSAPATKESQWAALIAKYGAYPFVFGQLEGPTSHCYLVSLNSNSLSVRM